MIVIRGGLPVLLFGDLPSSQPSVLSEFDHIGHHFVHVVVGKEQAESRI